MKDHTYYLVTLFDKELQRQPQAYNKLVVDLHPTDWFGACEWYTEHVLLNFWEITEGTFNTFPHDMQNLAWDELYQITGEEDAS